MRRARMGVSYFDRQTSAWVLSRAVPTGSLYKANHFPRVGATISFPPEGDRGMRTGSLNRHNRWTEVLLPLSHLDDWSFYTALADVCAYSWSAVRRLSIRSDTQSSRLLPSSRRSTEVLQHSAAFHRAMRLGNVYHASGCICMLRLRRMIRTRISSAAHFMYGYKNIALAGGRACSVLCKVLELSMMP